MAIEITKPRVIICEGESDVAFFDHLISNRGLPEFQALSANGRTRFESVLVALSAASGFNELAGILVVGDNDLDPATSFRNIQTQIQAAGGYGVPERPGEPAKEAGFPAIVAMMVPWDGRTGCLETLLLEAVREVHPDLGVCVDGYAACTHVDVWNETELPKVKLQSLTAVICRSNPTVALRYAWGQREDIIPLGRPCFDQIVEFLRTFPDLIA